MPSLLLIQPRFLKDCTRICGFAIRSARIQALAGRLIWEPEGNILFTKFRESARHWRIRHAPDLDDIRLNCRLAWLQRRGSEGHGDPSIARSKEEPRRLYAHQARSRLDSAIRRCD